MSTNLAPMIDELRRAYGELVPHFTEYLNHWHSVNPDIYPATKMPMPVITIQRKGRRKSTRGWYKTTIWNSDAAAAYNTLAGKEIVSTDEICITAESLQDATAESILVDLTHQMIHHYAAHNYTYATLGKNDYHNTTFRSLANRVGLTAEFGSNGYSETSLDQYGTAAQSLKAAFEKINLDMSIFDMFRKQEGTTKAKGSKLKKWSCDCTSIRVAVYVDSVCSICDKPFIYDDKDKNEQHVQTWLRDCAKKVERHKQNADPTRWSWTPKPWLPTFPQTA